MMSTRSVVPLSSKLYGDLVDIVRKSYKDACVLYIDKITSPLLEEAFIKRKELFMKSYGDADELQLYHGTNSESVDSILEVGFKASYSKVAAYGRGTYFSATSKYSKQYTDITSDGLSFLLVNRVLLGQHTVSVNGSFTGDSGGDGRNIYVVKWDDAILPEYIICFHKNAA